MADATESSESGPQTDSLDHWGDNMGIKRLLGAAAAATIAAIAPLSATIASAEEVQGVGTGSVSATVLQVDVGENGSILSVRVLGDDGSSTTDPANGTPSSSTSLTPLTITSATVNELNVTSPSVSTSSDGPEDAKTVSPDLPDLPAFSGEVTATLSSIVDGVGARSGLDATLENLSVAGGLLSVPSATVALATNAAGAEATSTRSISIPSIEVLNLGAVLEGAGLSLADLPVQTLLDLLAGLDVAIPDLADPAGAVTTVNGAIDAVQDLSGTITTEICATVDGALGSLGGIAGANAVGDTAGEIVDTVTGGGVPAAGGIVTPPALPISVPLRAQALPISCEDGVGTVNDLIDQLQGLLGDTLGAVAGILDNVALLSASGIEIGLTADAKSTVDASVAEVTGTIGSVKVGNLTLPALSGLDLTAATDVLNLAGDTVSATVGDVLGIVNTQLAGMIDVDVMAIDEIVAADGGYSKATAAVTALTATITPPDLLSATADLGDTLGAVLGEVGTAVPPLAPVMGELSATLGGLDILTAPSTITVGRLSSASAFRPVSAQVGTTAAPTPTGELPRTGTNAAVPAMAAVLIAGAALGIRKFLSAIAV